VGNCRQGTQGACRGKGRTSEEKGKRGLYQQEGGGKGEGVLAQRADFIFQGP